MPGWGRSGEGEGEGNGGRAQRTEEPTRHGQLRRSRPRLIPASPLPSSSRCEQHPLQTLGPHARGRPASAAPSNCFQHTFHPGNFLHLRPGVGGCAAWEGFSWGSVGGSLWRRASGSQGDARHLHSAPSGPAVGSRRPLFPCPPTMTEMSEKENEPDDAATHTPPGTVSALQETKVTRGA